METKEIVINMLQENTGRHMMDSGGVYGRHWEHNQLINDWDNTPRLILRVQQDGEFYPVKSLYHHMIETLEYNQDMDNKLQDIINSNDDSYDDNIQQFIKENYPDATYNAWYTYNGDNILSQDIIIHQINDIYADDNLTIIQIHNGCDARGGFTRPRAFNAEDYFMLYNDADISCDKCGASWYTDDGYNWYANTDQVKALHDDTQEESLINLDDYDTMLPVNDLKEYDLTAEGDTFEDNKLMCPVCKRGYLS